MVLAAVGVVSVPSGLIASGFAQVVRSKAKARKLRRKLLRAGGDPNDSVDVTGSGDGVTGAAGDGYFERRYAELEGVMAPSWPCCSSPSLDEAQVGVNAFLNGQLKFLGIAGGNDYAPVLVRTFASTVFRGVVLFLIVTNVIAVVVETIPSVDRAVGNQSGNFFDVFEAISVTVFLLEYLLRIFSVVKDREHLYSTWFYATTFFGIVDLLAFAPYFIEQILLACHAIAPGSESATIFRLFRIFRILQLEHFVVAFTVLDNVFRASRDVLRATGLMALIIWVGCAALFFIFEQDNPNWRSCADDVPLHNANGTGCFDFASTAKCNAHWGDGQCTQSAFVNMPDALYYTAVFLGGEWGKVDFTVGGRLVCVFLCVAGIAIYAIPIGTLFDSFGAVLGMGGDDDDDEDDE